MRARTAASIVILASTAFAAPPKAAYRARAIGATDAEIVYADRDMRWRCSQSDCRGEARVGLSADEICAALSARFGPVNAFASARGDQTFDSRALYACNARADELKAAAAVMENDVDVSSRDP